MKSISVFARLFWLLCATGIHGCGTDSPSIVVEEWPVDGKLVGASEHGGKAKKSRDLSGIACDRESGFPRNCLVVDDEAQSAQAVTVNDGSIVAGGVVPLISNTFDGDPLELDGEAVAFADGSFLVVGSHGHPRDRKARLDERSDADEIRAKITASSQILRVRLPASAWRDDGEVDADVTSSNRLREAFKTIRELGPYIDRRLDQSGLTLEGAAVANGRFYAGLRSPVLDGMAVVVHVDLQSLYGNGPLEARIHRLDLAGHGIRDLVAHKGGFVVLAGPAPDQDGAFAVYSWNGSDAPELIGALPDFDEDEKPEAILPLEQSDRGLRLLVISDGGKEGRPRAVTLRQ